MNRFLTRSLLFFVCILGIISCTSLNIAVTWADTYIASQVDDYFDLSSQQNKDLKVALKKDIQKIRHEQFPKWAQTLRGFEKEVAEDKISEESFHKQFRETIDISKNLQPMFTDTAVNFITTASQEQLVHFEKAIRKKNVEDEEKIQDSEKTRNESRKKYLRGIEMWVDSLSKDQEQLLNRHLNENPFPAQALIKNRNQVLEKFIEARKTPEDLKNFVRNYYNNKTQFADPEYQVALKTYQDQLEKFMYQLVKSLSDKQKANLRENLTEKAALLEKLATKE